MSKEERKCCEKCKSRFLGPLSDWCENCPCHKGEGNCRTRVVEVLRQFGIEDNIPAILQIIELEKEEALSSQRQELAKRVGEIILLEANGGGNNGRAYVAGYSKAKEDFIALLTDDKIEK